MRSGTVAPEGGRRFSPLRNRPLLTLMLGHFTVDLYAGLLPVLYPLLIDRFALDLKTVGVVSLAYTGVASLSQPLFGWLADRYGTRFIGLALAWTGLTFATIGFAPSFPVLVVLAAAAGLGSGAYHPLGALNAGAVIPDGQRNIAMSIYTSGGTLGIALGPLVGVALFAAFDVRGTALMLLPGVSIAAWLLVELRRIAVRRPGRVGGAAAGAPVPVPVPLVPLLAVIGVMMLRSWTLFGIQAYIPTWYRDLGYGASFYGPLATTIQLASVGGAIGFGSLADRYGRRALIVGSLVLSIPALLLFAQFPGPFAFVTAALVGLLAASTAPLLLVLAQQLMAGRGGLASGLMLGLGFVTGAIGVPVMGALADVFGMQAAMRSQALVTLVAIAFAWLLPGEARLRALREGADGRGASDERRATSDEAPAPNGVQGRATRAGG